ncbi:DNA polymerase III subunit gamma/tau [Myxococcota bacterium]|nr:DNA polymerase III subunit gamma/tau [Myxococcota bacterium]MBU1533878.1 DNA polymerase III subunit gamma/tau [Myxococcota bacterium]
MAYLVLARRYRPQSFSELIGQEHIITILTNALTSGRIHHAFLFTGARGTGKTTTARLLAKALNCNDGPTPTPCNQCVHCTDITVGKEVDVLEIDGATNTGVENVRALREDIRFLPSSGRYRVIIIDEVHMLTVSAFNALLKTLEEPPSHVIFIFATTEPHKIPATILSRVQRFDFKRVDLSRLSRHVMDILEKESFTIDPQAATLIAMEGEGSVRDTLSILDQILASHQEGTITEHEVKGILGITDRAILSELSLALLARDGDLVLRRLHDIFYEGYDIVHFTKSLVSFFRDLMVIKTVKQPEDLVFITDDALKELQQHLKPFSIQHLHHLFLRLFNGLDAVSRALSPKTALELLLMDLVLAEPLSPAMELFDRMSRLEAGARSQAPAANARISGPPAGRPAAGSVSPAPSRSQSASPTPVTPQSGSTKTSPVRAAISSRAAGPEPTEPSEPSVPALPHVPADQFAFKDWMKLLDSISKSHGRLYVCLQTARFVSEVTSQGGLRFNLTFSEGENTFSIKYLQGQQKQTEALFAELTGHPVAITIATAPKADLAPSWHNLPQGVPVASPYELEKQQQALKERAIDETIRSNPVVRKLLDSLGGDIIGQRVKED